MASLVSRFGRGAAKNARGHFQSSCRAAHALANNGADNGHNFNAPAASRLSNTNANDVPSLRKKLESDINALEWDAFTSSTATALNENGRPASQRSSSSSSLRSGTAALAARIANSVDCTLDPRTPRYLASAMEDFSSSQCRLIVSAEPPFRVIHASPSWESLTGITRDHTEGRPALSVLLSAHSTQLEGVDNLMESLHLHCRGCGTVACRASGSSSSSFPAKVTVSPLIDGNGDISHMLCVVKPL